MLNTYAFQIGSMYVVTMLERSLGDALVKLGHWVQENDIVLASGSDHIRVMTPEVRR